MATRPRNGLSLCAGAGGLDMGLLLAEPGFHTRCFVEWDEYPRKSIIAAQRAGYFAPAPIWDDLTTFDARRFAGAIDTLLAGYPCQPFSMAGQRKGADDPRHLWPHVARVARELGPALRWIFLENVSGHVTLGAEAVLRELRDMGFTPAAGIFSAQEVGAPHERQRWFCAAYREGRGCGKRWDAPQQGRSGYADSGYQPVADANGRNPGTERKQRSGEQRFQPEGGSDGAGTLDHTAGARRKPAGGGPEAISQGGECLPCDGRAEMADPAHTDGQRNWRGAAGRGRPANDGADMADPGSPRSQGRERPGSHDQRDRAPAYGPAAECGSAWIFPPGPGDADAWGAIIGADPSCAPSISRSDAKTAALNFAALFDPDEAEAAEQSARGMALSSELSEVVSEAISLVDKAPAFARFRRVADGLAHRTRALRLLGNGVCPLAAGYAWRSLASAHGLLPVDLEAAEQNAATHTNEPDLKGRKNG